MSLPLPLVAGNPALLPGYLASRRADADDGSPSVSSQQEPTYRVRPVDIPIPPEGTMAKGYDFSHYQSQSYPADAEFGAAKATQGTWQVDSRHAQHVADLRGRGLPVIHYHYADGGNWQAEANYFLAHADWRPGEAIALDVEGTLVQTANCVRWALAWLDYVAAKTGAFVMMYTSDSVLSRYNWAPVTAKYAIWVARYPAPGSGVVPKHPYFIWQYTSNPVDTNTTPYTKAQLRAMFDTHNRTPAVALGGEDDEMARLLQVQGNATVWLVNGNYTDKFPIPNPARLADILKVNTEHQFLFPDANVRFVSQAFLDMIPNRSEWQGQVYNAMFLGGSSMKDYGQSVSQSLATIHAMTVQPGIAPVRYGYFCFSDPDDTTKRNADGKVYEFDRQRNVYAHVPDDATLAARKSFHAMILDRVADYSAPGNAPVTYGSDYYGSEVSWQEFLTGKTALTDADGAPVDVEALARQIADTLGPAVSAELADTLAARLKD